MTAHTDDQRPLWFDAHAEATVTAPDVAPPDVAPPDVAPDVAPPRNTLPRPVTTPRGRRAPDYRLRGLDLDAPSLAEAPPRPVLKKGHPSRRQHRRRLLVQCTVALAVVAAVAVLLRVFVVQPYAVTSTSMVPTLRAGTDVLVVRSSRLTGSIKAGDIVVFHEPKGADCASGGGSHDLVERVIGVPGQTIWSVDGTIYINGQRLNEPGWYNPPFGEVGSTEIARTSIPQGSYFAMGDNRTDSCDSRSFGPIRKSLLVGRVVATVARNGHPFVHLI